MVQVDLIISCQNNRFESDIQFHINNDEGLYDFPDDVDEQAINKNFVDAMKEKEEHLKEFLQKYYNLSVQLQYSNLDKICRFHIMVFLVETQRSPFQQFLYDYFDLIVSVF